MPTMNDSSRPSRSSSSSKHRHRSQSSRSRSSASAWNQEAAPRLVMLTDMGIYLTLFIIPWIFAGRFAWGHVVVLALTGFSAVCWSLYQFRSRQPRYLFSGFELIFAAVLVMIAVQLCPLGPDTIKSLSPEIPAALELQTEEAAGLFKSWNTLSLVPEETKRDLIILTACTTLFLIGIQRFRSLQDIRRLFIVMSVTATLIAVFGILQFLTSNGKFFWFYEHYQSNTYGIVRGPYTNPNSCSNFLALAMPMTIALLVIRADELAKNPQSELGNRLWIWLHAISLAILVVADLLTLSRGGIVVGAVGVFVTLAGFWWGRLISSKTLGIVLLGGVLSCGFLTFFGTHLERHIQHNFNQLASVSVDKLDAQGTRRALWSAVWSVWDRFPIFGVGLGGHRDSYQRFYETPLKLDFTHSENSYLQVGVEGGMIGIAILAVFILMVLIWTVLAYRRATSREATALTLGAATVFVIALAHAITDFFWYAPANANFILLTCAAVFHLSRRCPATPEFVEQASSAESTGLIRRLLWLGGGLSIGAAAIWGIQIKVPEAIAEQHYFDYLRWGQRISTATTDEERAEIHHQRFRAISLAVRNDPMRHRYLIAAAKQYLVQFNTRQMDAENVLNLPQLRQAVGELGFASKAEADAWLNKPGVIGKTRKYLTAARSCLIRAIQLCPLHAEPYALLREILWLEWPPKDLEDRLIAQALHLRPREALVNFAWGASLMQRQEYVKATEHWKITFVEDDDYREKLIVLCGQLMPASYLLENFPVDDAALASMQRAYKSSRDVQGYREIVKRIASNSEAHAMKAKGTVAADHWFLAFNSHVELGNQAEALRCAQATAKANPFHVKYRKTIGSWMFVAGYYKLAAEELAWCVKIAPEDKEAVKLAGAAFKKSEGAVLEANAPPSDQRRR